MITHVVLAFFLYRRQLLFKTVPDSRLANLDGECRMPIATPEDTENIDVPSPIPLLGHERNAIVIVRCVDHPWVVIDGALDIGG